MTHYRRIVWFRSWAALAVFWLLPLVAQSQIEPPKGKSYGDSEAIEKLLAKWKPPKGQPRMPRTELRSADTKIEGVWEINRGNLEFSRLTITRSSPGTYAVELYHTCCVAGWKLKRTGRYDKGILTLELPITESYGEKFAYQTIYAVKISGTECLLPANTVEKVEPNLLTQQKYFEPDSAESQYGFRRAPSKTPK